MDFFFIEEKKLKGIFLREKNNIKKLKDEVVELIKVIKQRYFGFFIFVIIVYAICLYYLLCFNSIYPKIQIEWIKSSIFLILVRQILSVLQCLLETILRYLSFKCDSERIFKVSKNVNWALLDIYIYNIELTKHLYIYLVRLRVSFIISNDFQF